MRAFQPGRLTIPNTVSGVTSVQCFHVPEDSSSCQGLICLVVYGAWKIPNVSIIKVRCFHITHFFSETKPRDTNSQLFLLLTLGSVVGAVDKRSLTRTVKGDCFPFSPSHMG